MPPITALIFDLGGVLFSWWPPQDSKLSPTMLKRAMSTKPWHDFERGLISEEECFDGLELATSIPVAHIAETIQEAKLSLETDNAMLELLRYARSASVSLYLMSNISKPYWDFIRGMDFEWDLFDDIFISAETGMRKPDLCFYEGILRKVGLAHNPSSALFIDDRLENVVSARTVGIQAMLFDSTTNVVCRVYNILEDPIARAKQYLETNAGRLNTTIVTAKGQQVDIKENFAQLLILDVTRNKSLVILKDYSGMWNYFQEQPILTTSIFPDDFDTTSMALSVLQNYHPSATLSSILDLCLQNQSSDRLPMVYNDPSRPRVDPVVCANIYTLFHINRRSHQLKSTWEYLCRVLENRAYEDGTYYYTSSDYFLYSFSRLMSYAHEYGVPLPCNTSASSESDFHNDGKNFRSLFKARCRERINVGPGDALSLAVRIIACRVADIPGEELARDAARLKDLQQIDGGWPWCEIYKVPSAKAGIGSRGVVTAFSVKALEMLEQEDCSLLDSRLSIMKGGLSIMKCSWCVVRAWWKQMVEAQNKWEVTLVSAVASVATLGFSVGLLTRRPNCWRIEASFAYDMCRKLFARTVNSI